MNSKLTSYLLLLIVVVLAAFSFYSNSQVSQLKKEAAIWKDKYEEALEDMEDAFKRLEVKDNQLKAALREAEDARKVAEEALVASQKPSRK